MFRSNFMLSHYHCTNAHTFLNTFGQVGVMVEVGFLTSVGQYMHNSFTPLKCLTTILKTY